MLPLEVGDLRTHALAYPQMDWWMSFADGTCWQKVPFPPQCEGELMQATPCGLVTSSGKRETCGLYCLDHNPLCMEGSNTCVKGVHRRKMQTHPNASISVSDSNVNNADLKRTHGNSTLNTYNKEFPVDNFRSL